MRGKDVSLDRRVISLLVAKKATSYYRKIIKMCGKLQLTMMVNRPSNHWFNFALYVLGLPRFPAFRPLVAPVRFHNLLVFHLSSLLFRLEHRHHRWRVSFYCWQTTAEKINTKLKNLLTSIHFWVSNLLIYMYKPLVSKKNLFNIQGKTLDHFEAE